MSYAQNFIDKVTVVNEEEYTPVETEAADKFKKELTNCVNSGLDPEFLMKMTTFMCVLVDRGLHVDKLQDSLIFIKAMVDNTMDFSNEGIDRIIAQIDEEYQNKQH